MNDMHEVLVVVRHLKPLDPAVLTVIDPANAPPSVDDPAGYCRGLANAAIADCKKQFSEFNSAEFYISWVPLK